MNKWLSYTFVLLSILLFVILFYKLQTVQQTVESLKSEKKKKQEEEEIEVADVMMKLQRHSSKLWFAGQHQNWDLAEFYAEEVEEAMSTITKQKVTEEGVNLTELMKMMGEKPLNNVRKAIQEQDTAAFAKQYRLLIRNCNDCHRSSKHEFIQVEVPQTPAYENQIFAPSQ